MNSRYVLSDVAGTRFVRALQRWIGRSRAATNPSQQQVAVHLAAGFALLFAMHVDAAADVSTMSWFTPQGPAVTPASSACSGFDRLSITQPVDNAQTAGMSTAPSSGEVYTVSVRGHGAATFRIVGDSSGATTLAGPATAPATLTFTVGATAPGGVGYYFDSASGIESLDASCAQAAAPGAIPDSERAALINLFNSAGGASWIDHTGWCATTPCNGTFAASGTECSWTRVGCDATSSHVTGIDLSFNGANGRVPALDDLSLLQDFSVGHNVLFGSIPDLSVLSQLTIADFYDNQFTGSLPALAGLTNLSGFRAYNNSLTGSLPDLTGLSQLTQFVVFSNALSGSLPSNLNTLTALQVFQVGNNALSGTLPSFDGLTQLQYLDLDGCQFTGAIPPLNALSSLLSASLGSNQLSGPVPALPNALNSLNVSNNQLSGPIPVLPSGLTNLLVSNNQLSGPIPALPSALQFADLSYNRIGGTLPDLSALTALTHLYVNNNALTGTPPPPPASLLPNQSALCPNRMVSDGIDAAWNAATGQSAWWGPPGGGCDGVYQAGFELLANGSFERGVSGWTIGAGTCLWQSRHSAEVTAGGGEFSTPGPVDGSYVLTSDSEYFDPVDTCRLYQDVVVPTGVANAMLSAALGYQVSQFPGATAAGCEMRLLVARPDGSLIHTYGVLSGSSEQVLAQFAPQTFGVRPGEILRITVQVTTCGQFAGAVVDNLSLTLN